jgi:hypothetical protein
MGVTQSKQSSRTPSSLSFLQDRRARNKDQQDRQAKDNKSSTRKRYSKRLSFLSKTSKMKTRGSSSTSPEDDSHTITATAGGSIRRSSRRRTRSIALLQQNEADTAEDDSEHITSRRIRRRIKGKSKQVDADCQDANERVAMTKGKKRQTEEDERMDELEIATDSLSSAVEQSGLQGQASQSVSIQTEQVPAHILPPHVDPPQAQVSASTTTPQPNQTTSPSQWGSNTRSRSPYDLTDADRNRAREQIARALGMRAMSSLQSTTPTAEQSRPSMLSALLTDILGLRTSQAVSTDLLPGSRPQNASIGNSDTPNPNPRPRATNGGTSVIVQGALISRTVPSRLSTPSSNAEDATTQAGEAAPLRRSHSQPVLSAAEETGQESTALPTLSTGSETQVATIEEQAAMLIRLLSIAAAATAASLVSRMPQRPSNTSVSNASPTTGTSQMSAPTSEATSTESSASTLSVSASSLSPSWLQASQTYQVLRDRYQSLRNRLRSLRAAAEPNFGRLATTSVLEQTTEGSERARANQTADAEAVASRAEADAASSLRSLSSMLQDAIRDGVTSSERNSTRSTDGNQDTPPAEATPLTLAQSVHATLSAVRGGSLIRGSPPSFDRFLFDLMGDLDVAIRGLPRDGEATPASEATSEVELSGEERAIRHRRRYDVHDGQLAFYRQYTFYQAADENDSPLLPCVVIGVRNLEPNNRTVHIQQVNTEAESGVFLSQENRDTVMGEAPSTASSTSVPNEPTVAPTTSANPATATSQDERPMSRFLLFVSGGHYLRSHPIFNSSRTDASRDLMILMEFLGAMASMHMKANTTVTKEQIEKSKLRNVSGNLQEIASLVAEKKIMENTSERCLICLEDWKDEEEDRRLLECAHLFHAPCIDQWLTASNNSCPLCRRQAVATSTPSSSPLIVPTATSLADN